MRHNEYFHVLPPSSEGMCRKTGACEEVFERRFDYIRNPVKREPEIDSDLPAPIF
jgi:hypothetical protein